MKEIKVLKPSYYDSFFCSGKNCKLTCCKNWAINFSEKEVQKLKALSEEVSNECDKFLIKENNTNYPYKIVLNEENFCPWLTEDGLCSLQQKYGYEILPQVCKVFPRQSILFRDILEMHLSLGCEEVIKQLIKQTEGIKFVNQKRRSKLTLELKYKFEENEIFKKPILNYYYDIKVLSLSILQDRNYTIEQRLLILGIAMKKLEKMEKENKIAEIPAFVDAFLEMIEKEDFAQSWNTSSSNERIQMLHNVVNLKGFLALDHVGIEIYKKIEKRVVYQYDDTIEPFISNSITKVGDRVEVKAKFSESNFSLEKYKEAIKQYQSFIQNKEYYIENYLVACLGYKNIPFCFGELDIWEGYCSFVITYSMYRFMLTCCLDENSKDEDFIHYTTLFSRLLLHSRKEEKFKDIVTALKSAQKDTLEYLGIMLLQQ